RDGTPDRQGARAQHRDGRVPLPGARAAPRLRGGGGARAGGRRGGVARARLGPRRLAREDRGVRAGRLHARLPAQRGAGAARLHRVRSRPDLASLIQSSSMASPSQLTVGGRKYEIFRLDALQASHDVARLPYTLRILLENVLRTGTDDDVEAVAGWVADEEPHREISFSPGRVLMQDLTGVPAVVDLAAMRAAMHDLGGDPAAINPQIPVELVIDHSVQVDAFASRAAFATNVEREFERNVERYAFLRWGQQAFVNFKVV